MYLIGRYCYFGHVPTNESFPEVHVNRGRSCTLIRATSELGVIEIQRVSSQPASAFSIAFIEHCDRLSNPALPLEIEGSSNPARMMGRETPNHPARTKPSKLLSGHLAIAIAGFFSFFSDAFFSLFITLSLAIDSFTFQLYFLLYYCRIFNCS
jgi:hypothetical protein